jgi:6-phosphogluconolactonase (cycloisomerase 2 family)
MLAAARKSPWLLYSLNEDSDSIVILSVDVVSGSLAPVERSLRCASPVCMAFSG